MHVFVLSTLFDITYTGVLSYKAKENNLVARNQQRNWQVLHQLLQLRTQPIFITQPVMSQVNLPELEIGIQFPGIHKVWVVVWAVEHTDLYSEQQDPVSILRQDFDKIPMIIGLDETVKFNKNCLETTGPNQNIAFSTRSDWNNRIPIDFDSLEKLYLNK